MEATWRISLALSRKSRGWWGINISSTLSYKTLQCIGLNMFLRLISILETILRKNTYGVSVVLITSRESIRSKLIVKRRHLLKQYSFDRWKIWKSYRPVSKVSRNSLYFCLYSGINQRNPLSPILDVNPVRLFNENTTGYTT